MFTQTVNQEALGIRLISTFRYNHNTKIILSYIDQLLLSKVSVFNANDVSGCMRRAGK